MTTTQVQGELELFSARRLTPLELEDQLNAGHPLPIRLKIHQNQVTMVSIKFHADHVLCRLHEAFLSAPAEIQRALRVYLRTRRTRYWQPVADFAQRIEATDRRPIQLASSGRCYDLLELLQEINQTWFDGSIDVHIGWGRQPRRKARSRHTSIHFGTYAANSNLIRIHPRLDRRDVPVEFVKFVIYHEILHIVHPPYRKNGRWVFHSRAFKQDEKKFPGYDQMQVVAKNILTEVGNECA